MENIMAVLSSIQLSQRNILFALIMISTMLLFFSVALLISGRRTKIKRQLSEIRQENQVGSPSLNKIKNSKISNTLESISPMFSPKDIKERDSVRHQLMHAGFHSASALNVYYAVKTALTLAAVALSALVFFLFPNTENLLLIIVTSIAVGLFGPNVVLRHLVKKRKSKIRGGIADALDLLVVCTESGLGFNAALRRVADELVISHPELADELDTVCAKIKAGVEVPQALAQLVERTGITEISGLVSMLAHASRIGGSLAQTLRDYTEDFRDKRNQEVEEIAAKIPTKMIFPLLLFIWPCFFIVAVGPTILFLLVYFSS
ncbi:type II secretion system F family protein [Vibrio sp. CDRSL-10 TSBA]